ncbi:GNAT family N-acetyltransferase [Phytohabitans sp. LJ34]|uniref:GNAT family N-acetyltransferase n=1 Tax=Phytohabitans sp. LJ34 TaxID=3452217 RepID=UPI003F8A8F57
MTLPAGWTIRRPTLDDVAEILALVHASDLAAMGEPDFSADDVREALVGSAYISPSRDSLLAYAPDGALGGWAYLENDNGGDHEFVEVYTHPETGQAAQAPLLALTLARVAERAREFGHAAMTVRAGAIPTEKGYIATLRDAGFEFVKRYARMQRSLADVPATPPPTPDGVSIRPVDPGDDGDMRLFHRILDTAFRDTPDYRPRTYEQWREWVDGQPSVAWDEWLVATADGTPAGILQSSNQSLEDDEGWVKMLAVAREHRRRGIGEALLRRAFALYAAKGRANVGLGVDLENPTEAARLYHAVGLTAVYEADMFERTVTAA